MITVQAANTGMIELDLLTPGRAALRRERRLRHFVNETPVLTLEFDRPLPFNPIGISSLVIALRRTLMQGINEGWIDDPMLGRY